MKKIAIVTMSYGSNYGNKLQNYALQEVYNRFGYEVETLRLKPSRMNLDNSSKEALNLTKIINRLRVKMKQLIYKNNILNRKDSFEFFNNNVLKMTDKVYCDETIHLINQNDYSFFSAGSDQVWNSYFDDFTKTFLLDFVNDNEKKISYAASFGVSDINEKYRNLFKEKLMQFKDISVREEVGKDIVKNLIGREATTVLDPTLLLSKEEWLEFIGANSTSNEGIALTYFLGELDKEYKEKLLTYVKKNNLKLIELCKIENEYYKYGPKEFVELFSKADIVFTDSFHACCFSIIFEKPFWVTGRNSVKKNMNSRIDTLLDKLQLISRKWTLDTNLNQIVDFSEAKKLLDSQIKESLNFIKRNVG